MTEHVLRSKTHDFLVWLLERTARWPKRLRYGLTGPLEQTVVLLVADLAEAEARRDAARLEALGRADGRLAAARALLRVGRDLGVLSSGSYEHAAVRTDEVGRLLGGWMRAGQGAPAR